MAMNDDALKRLYDQFPKLKNHQAFTSAEEFNNWRTTNAPEMPETIWDNYLAPRNTSPTISSQQNTTSASHNQSSFTSHSHPAHSSYRPSHDIEEDKTYQNIVKNHIDDWNKQNPNAKFKGKAFIKDSTGKLILNPELEGKITNIAGKTRMTMRTGFGDEAVDKYANAEKYRVYKNHAQDPEYQRLQSLNSSAAYDEFVNNHPEKAFAYARKDKELKKALKRRSERLERQYKEKIKKYKNPNDDPAFKKIRSDIDSATDQEYKNGLIRARNRSTTSSSWQEQVSDRTQAAPQIDREKIRQRIQQMKYDEFFESYPEKARAYSKKDPALKKAYENYQLRKKNQEKLAKKQTKKQGGGIFRFRRNKKPYIDPRILQLEQGINEQISQIDPATKALVPEKVNSIRKKSYENFVRKNPELVKNLTANTPEIKKAHERVSSAQKMAQKRGFLYKFRSLLTPTTLPTQASSTNTDSSLLKNPILNLKEWQNRIRPQNAQVRQKTETNSQDQKQQSSHSWREQGIRQIRPYPQSNPTPDGSQSSSSASQTVNTGSSGRKRIMKRPKLPSLSKQPPGIPGSSVISKAPFSLIRAIGMNPYVLLGILIVFFVVLLILIIYFIITGGGSTEDEFRINVTKTGPESVQNEEIIEYSIKVDMSGTADKVILTDRLPENTELAEAPAGAELKDANDTTTTDIKAARAVIWTITPSASGSAGGSNGTPPDLNAGTFEDLVKGQGRNTAILGNEDEFVDAIFTNILSSRSIGNRAAYESNVRTLYKTAVAKNVNPLIPLVIWGVEASFEISGTEFGCKPFGSGFATQVQCSVDTLDHWMADFETKKSQGIFPVPYTIHNTCNFEDPFIYAYEAYTPVCSMNDSNDGARTNFVILFKEFLGAQ